MKVLVIDNDSSLTATYCQVLQSSGNQAVASNSVADALQLIKKTKFDVIICGMLMPEQDGIDFLRAFKPLSNKNTKVIIFSSINNSEVMAAAKKLGAVDYCLKSDYSPYQINEVLQKAIVVTK